MKDVDRFFADVLISLGDKPFVRDNHKNRFLNCACVFDIETTSFYQSKTNPRLQVLKPSPKDEDDFVKSAIMYAWVIGINGRTIVGRTWEEALSIINRMVKTFGLHGENSPDSDEDNSQNAIIYIHNESFEFQFIKDRFKWSEVFALEPHKPLKATTVDGVEFRCSYLLTGYSLETVGKNLHKYHIKKMVGDLDYTKFRHAKTPLSPTEWRYVRNDGMVVMAHIQEEIERLNGIINIPLTKTGYVRKYCRDACLYEGAHRKNGLKWKKYHDLMLALQIKSELEYTQLKLAFQGGYTHADGFYSGKIVFNVTSMDETSAYPAVMINEKFPCGTGEIVKPKSKKEFLDYLKRYCCLFDIELEDVDSTFIYDHYISSSRCWDSRGMVTDNGRVVRAKMLKMTITEQDYLIMLRTYSWRNMKIRNMRVYVRQYLPTDLVKAIVKFYKDKTELKGVEGMEVEYLHSKENVNSCYGMTVTDIARDEIKYMDQEWETIPKDLATVISKYNLSKNRFLCYQWGVWVTAYARKNVWSAILECAEDYVYSDTDSVKTRDFEKHKPFFDKYNAEIMVKLKRASEYHHIPLEHLMPKTKNGEKKILGVWDFDGYYFKFKTLGAKRYMTLSKKGYSLTVSGVNKSKAIPWLCKESARMWKEHHVVMTPIDLFQEGLSFPPEATGKNIHSYLDYEQSGIMVDYLGNECPYHELSSVHLEATGYDMSLSNDYIDYLMNIMEEYQ